MQALEKIEGIGQAIDVSKQWFERIVWVVAVIGVVITAMVTILAQWSTMETILVVSLVVCALFTLIQWRREVHYVGKAKIVIAAAEVVYAVPMSAEWNEHTKILRLAIQFSTPLLPSIKLGAVMVDLQAERIVEGLEHDGDVDVSHGVAEVWFKKEAVNQNPVSGQCGTYGIVVHSNVPASRIRAFRGDLVAKLDKGQDGNA